MEPWLKPTFADRSASPGFAEVVHSVAVNAEEVTVAKADSSFEGLKGQIQARRDDGNGEPGSLNQWNHDKKWQKDNIRTQELIL